MTSVYYIDTNVFLFHFATLSYICLKSYNNTNRNSFNIKGITARKRVLGKDKKGDLSKVRALNALKFSLVNYPKSDQRSRLPVAVSVSLRHRH